MAPSGDLTDRDKEILILGFKCAEQQMKIDYDKLAKLAGLKNASTAQTTYGNAKRKLMKNSDDKATEASTSGTGADDKGVDVTPGTPTTPKPAAKAKPATTPRKRKVATSDATTPNTKKSRTTTKKKAAEAEAAAAAEAEAAEAAEAEAAVERQLLESVADVFQGGVPITVRPIASSDSSPLTSLSSDGPDVDSQTFFNAAMPELANAALAEADGMEDVERTLTPPTDTVTPMATTLQNPVKPKSATKTRALLPKANLGKAGSEASTIIEGDVEMADAGPSEPVTPAKAATKKTAANKKTPAGKKEKAPALKKDTVKKEKKPVKTEDD